LDRNGFSAFLELFFAAAQAFQKRLPLLFQGFQLVLNFTVFGTGFVPFQLQLRLTLPEAPLGCWLA
jgi:hypothetical protein